MHILYLCSRNLERIYNCIHYCSIFVMEYSKESKLTFQLKKMTELKSDRMHFLKFTHKTISNQKCNVLKKITKNM